MVKPTEFWIYILSNEGSAAITTTFAYMQYNLQHFHDIRGLDVNGSHKVYLGSLTIDYEPDEVIWDGMLPCYAIEIILVAILA